MKAEQRNLKCLLNYGSDTFLTVHCIEIGFLKYKNWLKNHMDYLTFVSYLIIFIAT